MARSHRSITAGAIVALLSIAVGATTAQGAELTNQTERFKCYVLADDGRRKIIYFYTLSDLPERFDDPATIAQAEIPPSVRRRIRQLAECVRDDRRFADSQARALERSQPK